VPILKFIHRNGLQERVGSSGLQLALRRGSRFARAETEWAEDTLALAYAHRGLVLLLNPSAQGLPLPRYCPSTLPLAAGGMDGLHRLTDAWRGRVIVLSRQGSSNS